MKAKLTILLLFGLCCAGCHRNNRSASTPVPRPVPFDEAEKLFAAGNYRPAVDAYEAYLQEHPSGANSEVALLRLATAHALPDSAVRDPNRAAAYLERLITLHPESPWRRHAQHIRRLQTEIEGLQERLRRLGAELDLLKKIDLQRRPSRPPP